MARKTKDTQMNLYYRNDGQAKKKEIENDIEKKKKAKEREKRIREGKQKKIEDTFDLETEMVIQMTNKNKIKKLNFS